MIQDINNTLHFIAEENKIFIYKENNIKAGTDIYLSTEDSIENYVEQDMDDDDKAWFESLKRQKEEHCPHALDKKKRK